MRDPITDAAQDPSCLLCLTPDRGGSWWSRLRPDGPWPSSVPENFAENAKAFYDCQAVVQEALDPTHDYSFLIEADRVSERTENSLFYAGTDKLPFGVYYHADHTIKFFSNLLRNEGDPSGTYASLNFYTGTDWLPGRHAFEARIEGNAITTYVDGVQCATSNKFARTGTAAVGLPNCNSGYVYKIQITDLTDNQVVWSYPSEAERVRLITKTNVRTDRGAFEAADSSVRWNAKTPLRWQNLIAATIVARATVGEFPETVFSFGLPANPLYSVILLRRSAENQLYASLLGTRADGSSVYRTMTADFSFVSGKKDTFAFVFDIDGDFMRLYANGELLASAAVRPLVAIAVDGAKLPGFMLGTISFSDAVNSGSAVSAALVFDRALSAAEIAALTPKQA